MSLNNRIAIRDEYEARGLVIDCQAMTTFKSSSHPGSTIDTLILEPEKPQEGRMNQPVAEAGVEEGVKSELCDHHATVSLSYARPVAVTVDVV